MPIEIERKFLLANDDWKSSVIRRIRIRDGLIASNNGNKARVRIADSNATITLKSRRRGPIRTEFEYAIPYSDAVTGDPRYRKINMETQHIIRLRESQAAAQIIVN